MLVKGAAGLWNIGVQSTPVELKYYLKSDNETN